MARKRKVTLQTLIRDARRNRDNIAQLLRDKQHWNRTRTDCPPLDLGWETVALILSNDLVAAYERGDTLGPEAKRLLEHMKTCLEGS